MARSPYSLNSYTGAANPATLVATGIGTTETTITITGTNSSWSPLGTAGGFYLALDYGTTAEEKIYVPSGSWTYANTGVTLSGITRAFEGPLVAHSGGGYVVPVITATDISEANFLVNGLWPSVTETFDVVKYGAKGDAITDDTAAIQACLDASTPGSQIVFSYGASGIYLISSPLIFKPQRTYVGQGYPQAGVPIIRQKTGANISGSVTGLMVPYGWYHNYTYTDNPVRFHNLGFDGNSSGNSGSNADNLILMNFQSTVHNCYFTNAPAHCLKITDVTANGSAISGTSGQTIIDNNYFNGSNLSNFIVTSASGNAGLDGFLSDNFFANPLNGNSGAYFDSCAGWDIRGNHLYGITGNGIVANNCFGTRITDNYIESFGGALASGQNYTGIYASVINGPGTLITDNYVGMLDSATIGQNVGISVQNNGANYSVNAIVTDNMITGPGTNLNSNAYGILIQALGGSASNTTIRGNVAGNYITGVYHNYYRNYDFVNIAEDVIGNLIVESNATISGTLAVYKPPSATTPVSSGSITVNMNLGFTDVNNLGVLADSKNNYTQFMLQNISGGTTSSTNYVVNNNLATSGTYFAEFGINSSAFTGTGSFNLPSAAYLAVASGELAIGNYYGGSIHFTVSGQSVDELVISNSQSTFSNNVLVSGNTTTLSGTVDIWNTTNHHGGIVASGNYIYYPNQITTTTYSGVLSDAYSIVIMSGTGNPNIFYIPVNSQTAYPVGTQLTVLRTTASGVTISGTSGVTVYSIGATASQPKLRAQYSAATIYQAFTNVWYVSGDIA